MADTDVINVTDFDVIFCALHRVGFNQNRNAVFIRSVALCFILTVAIYSWKLYTLSISRLFLVVAYICSYKYKYLLSIYIVKLGVCRGIHFSYFALKHRLWALVRTSSMKRF